MRTFPLLKGCFMSVAIDKLKKVSGLWYPVSGCWLVYGFVSFFVVRSSSRGSFASRDGDAAY